MVDAPTNYLPILLHPHSGVTEWEREFCKSVSAQAKRGRALSSKQASTLTRIVDKFNERASAGDVIE